MFVGTIDELIALLETERGRFGGQAEVRIVTAGVFEEVSLPFVVSGHLKKEGSRSSRKTAHPCVFMSTGELK